MAEDRGKPALSELFWGVTRRLRHAWRETLAPWDIAPSQARALGVLARHGTMRLRDLTDHLHIAARSTTEVVDALEDRGLVERVQDSADRRATLVALTAEGTSTAVAIAGAREAEAEAFFGALDESDREHLTRILGKLLH
ncbi:MarR family winged helix-turn-helix transcriptional regulator [Antrihabitans sp. NCIMB 15449]|uniref:MarR family winged helix-turn-helix transcriptional regulator n=1 Tax=Antrihabitans spumae TaxID=3373370 RepID=A0ABW7JPG1_9NOCA